MSERIYLSPPHMSGEELKRIQQAFADNWVAPAGPNLAAFEAQLCDYVGAQHAVAVSSGTAAIHLALLVTDVQPDDEIFVSTLTFAGSVNPIIYMGAKPVFIDSEPQSWNMDPNLLEDALKARAQSGNLPKAVMPVHLYGQSADMDAIMAVCERYEVMVIEDAAEALGTLYRDRHPGTFGKMSAFSFNGNKIITTSGGGMLISDDRALIEHARKLASQSREPVAHYEHLEIGYNYRMSNILAAIGCGQMTVLEDRVRRKREIYAYYAQRLGDIPGLTFVDEMPYGRHTHWLTVMLVDPAQFGADREQIRLTLEDHNIESRPLWKPMHCQPVFQDYEFIGGNVADSLFDQGLCLPSGTALTDAELDRIISIIQAMR
ncbi:aminotransferase class I/II-fold pyridoxal phosphate-dependent enzyme [Phototrophicus methaneseepsis]|uniref:Aminotransferase class I/II-fold pyridoxal phosphate-dependent enzyme n=1 Tax=Phototrophicus methaneseepsis TaxID=2710758 RepID=A0A7S8EA94_9CHLR|nr:aminotransferase class I/II-fold pyridoxal phosphate-dependent enzyme [Phototrophicus methaneseepsis]QPC83283.1 aminotransferase class I/II-fold pyridoxal phosphate-dependent enzyme [Phototrophicus methaneseepsis]